jgi:hypothetical protein
MANLWTFGDSFTQGHGMNGEIPEYINADVNYKWTKLLSNTLGYDLKDFSKNGLTNESILSRVLANLGNFDKNDIVIIQSSTIGRYDFPFYHKISEIRKLEDGYTHYLNEIDSITHKSVCNGYELHDGNGISKSEYNASVNFMKYLVSSSFYYQRSLINLIDLVKHLDNKNIVKNVLFWNLESIRIDSISDKSPLMFNIFDDYDNIAKFSLYDNTQIGIDTFDYGWARIFWGMHLTIWHDTNESISDLHLSNNGHIWFTNFILKKLNINKKIKAKNII